MTEYRRPFLQARGPLADADLAAADSDYRANPPMFVQIATDYSKWMAGERHSEKLFVNADPGRDFWSGPSGIFAENWKSQTESHRARLAFHPGRFPGRRSAGRWPRWMKANSL